jgi:hypothetical protein
MSLARVLLPEPEKPKKEKNPGPEKDRLRPEKIGPSLPG